MALQTCNKLTGGFLKYSRGGQESNNLFNSTAPAPVAPITLLGGAFNQLRMEVALLSVITMRTRLEIQLSGLTTAVDRATVAIFTHFSVFTTRALEAMVI
jgi:hypothetical protein